MVCELLTCRTSSSEGLASRRRGNLSWRYLYSPLIAFPAMARPSHLTGDARDQLPACKMVLDIIGDLFTHGRQLKHLVFDGRIVSCSASCRYLAAWSRRQSGQSMSRNPMGRGRYSKRVEKGISPPSDNVVSRQAYDAIDLTRT